MRASLMKPFPQIVDNYISRNSLNLSRTQLIKPTLCLFCPSFINIRFTMIEAFQHSNPLSAPDLQQAVKLLPLSVLECSSLRICCLVKWMQFGIITLLNINNPNQEPAYHWIITTKWHIGVTLKKQPSPALQPFTIGTAFWQGLATMQPLPKSTPKHRHRPQHRGFPAAVRAAEQNIGRYCSALLACDICSSCMATRDIFCP